MKALRHLCGTTYVAPAPPATLLGAAPRLRRPVTDDQADAFPALYEVHYLWAYRLALHLCCGERATAEDAVADAFAAVWVKWRNGRVLEFRPYLRMAVIHNTQMVFRHRGRERREERRWRVHDHPEPDPEASATQRDEVSRALAQLSLRRRQVVVLRYYEDLPVAEIATVLRISTGTVKSHLSRGLVQLKALLENLDRSDE